MSGSLGSLVVEVAANVARFQSDMGRIAYIAQQNASLVQRAFDTAGNALKAIGVGLSVGIAFDTVKTKIDSALRSAAGLEDLAQRTGGTIEGLSRLSSIAQVSGTSTDSLATGLQRLAKSMVEAEQGGATAVAAFSALGISTKNLASQRPEDIFVRVATELAKYEDGATKTAVAQQLLGKSGANLLPVMNDLVTVGDLAVTTTAAQSAAAKAYEINLQRLQVSVDSVFKTIALQIAPVMGSFIKAMVSSTNSADGLRGSVDRLAADGSLRQWAEATAMGLARLIDVLSVIPDLFLMTGKTIAAAAAQMAGLGQVMAGVFQILSGDLTKGLQTAKDGLQQITIVGDAWWQDMQQIFNRPLFSERFKQQLAEDAKNLSDTLGNRRRLPDFNLPQPDTGLFKAQADAQAKVIERQIQQEQQLYQTRQQVLQRLYSQDLISIADYFAAREASTEAFRTRSLALYDQEIADLQRAMARMVDVRAKAELAGRIEDIGIRKERITTEVERQTVLDRLEQAKATRDYADEVERLNVRLLELQGNLEEASRRQQTLQNRTLRQRLTVEQDLPALQVLDRIERLQTQQASFSQFGAQAAVVEERLRNAEGRISLDQQRGAANELQSLARLSAARLGAVSELQRIAEQMDAVAQASGNPAMLANVEAFKLRIDALAASADGLGIVFRDIFVGGFSNFLSDLMSGTKSLKDAFLDFARSVEQAITRIVAQNLAQSLFGTTGPLAGVSGFFAQLFGAPVAGARADGGPVAANQSYLVGERGPEIFKPSIPGTIIPNERLKLETQVQGPKLLGAPAPRLAQALAATVVGIALPALPAAAAPSSALANTPRVTLPSGPPEVQAIAARLQTSLPAVATAALPPYMAAPLPPTLAAGLARRLAAVVEPAEMAVKTEERESELMNASRLPLGESLAVRISGSLQGGGPVYRNQAYLVGEAGPEVFIPGINGTVLPNKPAADNKPAGPNIVINNTFAAGTDLRTIDQAATQIGLRVQRALRRN
jgi:hypothetical protein